MIENLSWNAQKEGHFRTNDFLGSKSGSYLAKKNSCAISEGVELFCGNAALRFNGESEGE